MSNPLETAWTWVRTAPPPVAIALIMLLGWWVYEVDARVTEQANQVAAMQATLTQVDQNVTILVKAIVWEQTTHKKENR